VYEYGSSLLDILDPKPGERILDLGCGTGELSHLISQTGATVIGMDADPKMIHRAQSQFSDCQFMVGDARSFELDQQVDAVFSNAALHWVPEAERAAAAISRSLKPGGRLVAEFGGKRNIDKIAAYLDRVVGPSKNPWYFPSVAEYSSILEKHDLEVIFAQLFDRPTPLNEGENGLRNWMLMFGNSFLEGLDEEMTETVLAGAESELRTDLHNGEQWLADYRRIRIVASKINENSRPL
jgi:trans-aconitate 2-methyltransferase